jgi:hypothetical protein
MSSSLSGYGNFRNNTGGNLRGNTTGGDVIPKGYNKGQLQQFSPEQMQLFQQRISELGPDSYLSKLAGGDQGTFDEIEAPAYRDFNAIQGNIASRFSGMGSGARKSSGFQNAVTAAGSNFAQDLQSRRQDMRQQAINDLMGFSNTLLNQRPQENFLVQKPQKPQKSSTGFGSIIGSGLGAVGGYFAGGGNPYTALQGAQLGYSVGSAF